MEPIIIRTPFLEIDLVNIMAFIDLSRAEIMSLVILLSKNRADTVIEQHIINNENFLQHDMRKSTILKLASVSDPSVYPGYNH